MEADEATMTADEYDSYRQTLVDHALDSFKEYYRKPDYDAHDALSETAFDVADDWVYHATVYDAMGVLDRSLNEPTEWEPFAEGKNDWKDVIKAMAFTVVRQDFYDALEDEGYLDDKWNATDELRRAAYDLSRVVKDVTGDHPGVVAEYDDGSDDAEDFLVTQVQDVVEHSFSYDEVEKAIENELQADDAEVEA